jgi:SulP family sulfate permease
VIGPIPAGLPSLELPDVRLADVLTLVPPALGIFFVGFASEILTARSFAGRHGQHIHADAELAAMSAANLVAGVSQGFPVGGSNSRTAVNDQWAPALRSRDCWRRPRSLWCWFFLQSRSSTCQPRPSAL